MTTQQSPRDDKVDRIINVIRWLRKHNATCTQKDCHCRTAEEVAMQL